MKANKCKFFNLANVLTVAKGFVPFLIFFYPMNRRLVVVALVAMCALDMVDGKLARLTGTASPFGRALDIITFGASLETELSNRQRDKTIFLGR